MRSSFGKYAEKQLPKRKRKEKPFWRGTQFGYNSSQILKMSTLNFIILNLRNIFLKKHSNKHNFYVQKCVWMHYSK